MSRAEQLVAEVNTLKITESEGFPYDLPKDIREKYPELDKDPVETGLDRDEHRWYVLSTNVYAVGEEYVGVTVVESLKSESMDVDSCCNVIEMFLMREVKVVSYERV